MPLPSMMNWRLWGRSSSTQGTESASLGGRHSYEEDEQPEFEASSRGSPTGSRSNSKVSGRLNSESSGKDSERKLKRQLTRQATDRNLSLPAIAGPTKSVLGKNGQMYEVPLNDPPFKVAAFNFFTKDRMYNSPDPFAGLTALWLLGGKKGSQAEVDEESEVEEEDEEDEGEDEDSPHSPEVNEARTLARQIKAEEYRRKEAVIEAEEERMRVLNRNAWGHTQWLRGRVLGTEFVPTDMVRSRQRDAQLHRTMSDPGYRFRNGPVKKWFKTFVPADGQEWCWHGEFVDQARLIAECQRMHMAFIIMEKARLIMRRDPEATKTAFRHHVVAVASDGSRELWSLAFLQLLSVLFVQQGLQDGTVKVKEQLLRKVFPQIVFPVPGEYDEPQPRKAMKVRMPESVRASLDKSWGHPIPPPFPERLPCRVPYKLETSWTRILYSGKHLGEDNPDEPDMEAPDPTRTMMGRTLIAAAVDTGASLAMAARRPTPIILRATR